MYKLVLYTSSHKYAYLRRNALDRIDTQSYNGLDKAQKTPKIVLPTQMAPLSQDSQALQGDPGAITCPARSIWP